eukprot:746369-Hanusia_phi.AAC.1
MQHLRKSGKRRCYEQIKIEDFLSRIFRFPDWMLCPNPYCFCVKAGTFELPSSQTQLCICFCLHSSASVSTCALSWLTTFYQLHTATPLSFLVRILFSHLTSFMPSSTPFLLISSFILFFPADLPSLHLLVSLYCLATRNPDRSGVAIIQKCVGSVEHTIPVVISDTEGELRGLGEEGGKIMRGVGGLFIGSKIRGDVPVT